jgi:hypothetical protein
MVGGGLIELLVPLDSTKYLYRAVVFIPGLILLPLQLAEKQFRIFILPACYLLFGAISNCWSYSQGYQQMGSAVEYSFYVLSLLAVIHYAYKHVEILGKHLLLLLAFTTAAILSDIIHYFFFQEGNRLSGSFGNMNPGSITAIPYGVCTLLAFQQIIKQKFTFNFHSFIALLAACTSTTAVFLTNSRSSILSLTLALLIFCLIQSRVKVYCATFGILLTSALASLTINNLKFEDASSIAPVKQMLQRTSARTPIWQEYISRMNSKAFIYGRGLGVNDRESPESKMSKTKHPHNLFLSSFYYLGAIGTLLHMIMFFQIALQSYHDAQTKDYLLPCLFGLCFVPSIFCGISLHPYLDLISPSLLLFWFLYALSSVKKHINLY